MCNLFNTRPPMPSCSVHYLLPLAFFARRCSGSLLLRLLEHGKIAFHALAFFGTPAFHHLGPQQMLDVLGGDRRSGVQMHHEVQERSLLNARRLGIRVLHDVAKGHVLTSVRVTLPFRTSSSWNMKCMRVAKPSRLAQTLRLLLLMCSFS